MRERTKIPKMHGFTKQWRIFFFWQSHWTGRTTWCARIYTSWDFWNKSLAYKHFYRHWTHCLSLLLSYPDIRLSNIHELYCLKADHTWIKLLVFCMNALNPLLGIFKLVADTKRESCDREWVRAKNRSSEKMPWYFFSFSVQRFSNCNSPNFNSFKVHR